MSAPQSCVRLKRRTHSSRSILTRWDRRGGNWFRSLYVHPTGTGCISRGPSHSWLRQEGIPPDTRSSMTAKLGLVRLGKSNKGVKYPKSPVRLHPSSRTKSSPPPSEATRRRRPASKRRSPKFALCYLAPHQQPHHASAGSSRLRLGARCEKPNSVDGPRFEENLSQRQPRSRPNRNASSLRLEGRPS